MGGVVVAVVVVVVDFLTLSCMGYGWAAETELLNVTRFLCSYGT